MLVYFSNGCYLVSGSTDSYVYGWEVKSRGGVALQQSMEDKGAIASQQPMEGEEVVSQEDVLKPILHCHAHSDVVNGIR